MESEAWANIATSHVRYCHLVESYPALKESLKCGRNNFRFSSWMLDTCLNLQTHGEAIQACNVLLDLKKAGQKTSAGLPPFGEQGRLRCPGRIKTWKGSNCATTTTLPRTLAVIAFARVPACQSTEIRIRRQAMGP